MREDFENKITQKVFEILNEYKIKKDDIHDMEMDDIEYEIEMLADKMENAVLYCQWKRSEWKV